MRKATRLGVLLLPLFVVSVAASAPTAEASAVAVVSARVSAATATSQPADFNGDGFSDLAVGVANEDVGQIRDAGAVNVLYGSASGLAAMGSQFWHQASPGLAGDGAEQSDGFGSSLASSDFNGDGFSDLAVGVPFEAVGAINAAGAVNVLYGSSGGLSAAGSQFWNQDSPGVAGDGAEEPDFFGSSLVSGDFNRDGFGDLTVGVPGEWVGQVVDAGAMNLLYGSAAGLTATGSQFWNQNSPGVSGRAEEEDAFGWSVTAGDFNGDSFSDVAVGVPFEAVGAIFSAGAVNVLYGSPAGLTVAGNQLWHQNSPGVRGGAEGDDQFGTALAAANFGKSLHADLAVGVPQESVGAITLAGAVNVLYGSRTGLTATGNQLWHQGSPHVEGRVEQDDRFGSSLAAADFGKSFRADLAVGVPFEEPTKGGIEASGAANVLYGSSTGLTATSDQLWHQNSPGVIDESEDFDLFGWSLAAVNFGNSPHADLAVGVPGELLGELFSAGAANVIYGSATGLRSAGNQFWHQDSPGVAGDGAEEGDLFGSSLGNSPCNDCL